MQPPVFPSQANRHSDDAGRVRPAAEPKSWAQADPKALTRLYTHNAERFARRSRAEDAEAVADEDAEPALRPPPMWMLILAGAAVAAMLGVLLGGVYLDF